MHTTTDTARAQARRAFAQQHLQNPALDLQQASSDAGFRSYWRTSAHQPSHVVMDSPPDKEPVQPWLRMQTLLNNAQVRVPQVLAEDSANGFLLLEDVGHATLLKTITPDTAQRWFDAAITELIKIQSIGLDADFPKYDEALLLRELRLFDDWFCQTHLQLQLDCAQLETLDAAYRYLIDAALAQPVVLVHRDFMPRNLMPQQDGTLVVLDFQDAVAGPLAYDVLSLFKDAFISWPEQIVQQGICRYQQRASSHGLPVPALAQLQRDCDLIGIQRHLKVLGIFARLHHRDGKSHYLTDAPRFLAYLDAVLPQYPALAGLKQLLDTVIKPAFDQCNGARA